MVEKPAAPTTTFPRYPTPLLGREAELAQATALLATQRWLTVTGPAGVGKTRFAVELIQPLRPAAFVDASTLATAAELGAAVAAALGLKSRPDQDLWGAVSDQVLTPTWLVLDNLEQVPGAAAFVEALQAANPALRLLCTSRARLGGSVEQRLSLAPLSVDPLVPDGAVALFIERARARRPHWQPSPMERQLVTEICSALDGLPLAIELIAARSHSVPLPLIANRLLNDQPLPAHDGSRVARHASLGAALDWSLRRLTPEERRGLHGLALLKGSFSFAFAAQFLGACELPQAVLVALAEQGLVVCAEDRYRLLAPIRAELLARAPESPAAWRAYVGAVRAFVERFEPAHNNIVTERQMDGFRLIEAEWSHVRAAIDWTLQRRESALGYAVLERFLLPIRLALSSRWNGYSATLVGWFEALLAAEDLEPPRRLRVLSWFASVLSLLGDDRLVAVCDLGIDLAAQLNDLKRKTGLTINLALYSLKRHDLEAADRHFQTALEVAEADDREARAFVLSELGDIRMRQNRPREALVLMNQALEVIPDGAFALRCGTHGQLSDLYLALGDAAEALRQVLEVLRLAQRFEMLDNTADGLLQLARIAEFLGCQPLSEELAEAGAALRAQFGRPGSLLDPGRDVPGLIERAVSQLRSVLEPRGEFDLSPREAELLRQLVMGKSNREIAITLGISPRTVRNSLVTVYEKMRVDNRAHAIRLARERSLGPGSLEVRDTPARDLGETRKG